MIPTDEQIEEQAKKRHQSNQRTSYILGARWMREEMADDIFQFVPPTEEQIQERIDKIDPALSYERLGFKWGADWMLKQINDQKESFELGKCECGQEHDIRFMAPDSEGNHICYECYRSWVGEFAQHIRKLLMVRAKFVKNPLIADQKLIDRETVKYVKQAHGLIDKIGEDFTGVGKGWEEHIIENWEDEE